MWDRLCTKQIIMQHAAVAAGAEEIERKKEDDTWWTDVCRKWMRWEGCTSDLQVTHNWAGEQSGGVHFPQ